MNDEFSIVYPAKIKADGDGYIVTFRDLDNIFTEADSYEEAMQNAQEVLDMLLLDMAQNDNDIAPPTACRKGEVLITVSPEVAVPVLLHKLRLARQYTMADVADSMGVSYQNYQQIEAGKNITLKSLKRAAAALGAIVEIKLHTAKVKN
ncbi:MAG: type II toxin-antitoxin system HicB family antitoxin [Coxiellaceae bacterium]|nr:type II toxin-antitoxin system HicB family antitoxin [Coxiellaceae bacterium]